MTSSALDLIDTIEDTMEYKDIVVSEDVIKGMAPILREEIKKNIGLANEAWTTSGTALRACASMLAEIRANVKDGNWNALLKSGDLNFSKSVAIDLLAAHNWLESSSIPDRFLTNISARTLGTVARLKDGNKKEAIVEKIIATEGKGFPESELRKMMKKTVKVNKKAAGKKALKGLDPNASKAEAIDYYTKLVDDLQAQLDRNAAQLKKVVIANQDKAGEIGKLKEQIREMKAAA